jgi:hypothetical protein
MTVSNGVCSSAGQDATEAFYGLHRHEVLERPQYQRLQIGTIQGEQPVIYSRIVGEISDVPYAEPTWLSQGYHSPYYTEVSRQNRFSEFFPELLYRTIGNSNNLCVALLTSLFTRMHR